MHTTPSSPAPRRCSFFQTSRLLLIALLAATGALRAEDPAPVDQEICSEALEAVLEPKLIFEIGSSWSFCATWVSEDGRAIVQLQAMAYVKPPRFGTRSGPQPKFVKILAIDQAVCARISAP